MGIYELLDSNEDFDLVVSGRTVTVRRTSPEDWIVYLHPDLSYIGRFLVEYRDRATYYVAEVAGEPGTVNWVSDDITVLISRMLTLRD